MKTHNNKIRHPTKKIRLSVNIIEPNTVLNILNKVFSFAKKVFLNKSM